MGKSLCVSSRYVATSQRAMEKRWQRLHLLQHRIIITKDRQKRSDSIENDREEEHRQTNQSSALLSTQIDKAKPLEQLEVITRDPDPSKRTLLPPEVKTPRKLRHRHFATLVTYIPPGADARYASSPQEGPRCLKCAIFVSERATGYLSDVAHRSNTVTKP